MARELPFRLTPARILIGVLVLSLLILQWKIWIGDHGESAVMDMQTSVGQQRHENEGLRQRNSSLAAEVDDLKSGEAAVEERARNELGMIKPGETFYRVVPAGTMRQAEQARLTAEREAAAAKSLPKPTP